MSWHVGIRADAKNGKPLTAALVDKAGGRLALYQPSMNFAPDGPEVTVYIALEANSGGLAVVDAQTMVEAVFEALGEPLTFRSAAVYTEAEFDRVNPI